MVGGSLGGLTAALVLADVGCDVAVYERSSAALEARGAGIAVLDETVRWFAERSAVDPDELCSSTRFIRFLDADGAVVHEREHRYRFSAWNTIYRALLAEFPQERYLLGQEVVGFAPDGDGVALALRSGAPARADLVVCADGIGSTARADLLPEVTPALRGVRRVARHPARGRADAAPRTPRCTTRSPTRCCPTATSSSTRSPGRTGLGGSG